MATFSSDTSIQASALEYWRLSDKCQRHGSPLRSLAGHQSNVPQFAYCDVVYECGCTVHRTWFALSKMERVNHAEAP